MNTLTADQEADQATPSYALHYLLNFAQVVQPDDRCIDITASGLMQADQRALLQAFYRQLFAPEIPSLEGDVLVTRPQAPQQLTKALTGADEGVRLANNLVQWSPLHPPVRTRFYSLVDESDSAEKTVITPQSFSVNGCVPPLLHHAISSVASSYGLPSLRERALSSKQLQPYSDRLGEWANELITRMYRVDPNSRLTFRQVHHLMRACRHYMELRSRFPPPFVNEDLVPANKAAETPKHGGKSKLFLSLRRSHISIAEPRVALTTQQAAEDDNVMLDMRSSHGQHGDSGQHVWWYDRERNGRPSTDLSDKARALRWRQQHPAVKLVEFLRLDDEDHTIEQFLADLRKDISTEEAASQVYTPGATVLKSDEDMVESLRLFLETAREVGVPHRDGIPASLFKNAHRKH